MITDEYIRGKDRDVYLCVISIVADCGEPAILTISFRKTKYIFFLIKLFKS